MITINGRTRCQFYKGKANWAEISKVKGAVNIPVVANGDVVDFNTAKEAPHQSCADVILVGRGACGKPCLPAEVSQKLIKTAAQNVPDDPEFCSIVSEQYGDMLQFYGKYLDLRVARKHLQLYMDTAQTPLELRQCILRTASLAKVLVALPMSFDRWDGA